MLRPGIILRPGTIPENIYLFQVNNRSTRQWC